MAQQFITDSGNLIIPSAVAKFTVQTQNGGLATSGIIALIGEADSGPSFDQETDDLEDVISFGPGQIGDIVAKYKSGHLVDAARAAVQASNDPNITGAPSRILCFKTNAGAQASGILTSNSSGTYSTLLALAGGRLGNQLYYTVEADQAQVVPTTGSFTWIPQVGTIGVSFRINGGAAVVLSPIAAAAMPPTAVTALDGVAGIASTGGAARVTIVASTGTLALAVVSGNAVTITLAGATFTTTPSVGDTVVIPSGSVIKGATNKNRGAYVVTAATSTIISCTKLSNVNDGTSAIGAAVLGPEAVSAVAISGTAANDMVVYAPIVITMDATSPAIINGIGQSLEIAETTTGTDLLTRSTYALSTTVSTWPSTTAVPALLTSATEYIAQLNLARVSDNIDETIVAGGDVALTLSYTGTSGTVTITEDSLTTSITGGSGANLSLDLSDFATIGDLATYINSRTGYKAAVGNNTLGQFPSTSLDWVTAQGICSQFGAYNGRIKMDAYDWFNAIAQNSTVVQQGSPDAERADAGLPAVNATVVYMTGGTRGSTSNANVSAALDALAMVSANFVVPLFSQDATSDIADGETQALDTVAGEIASTYTVDAINALVKSHCIAMSKLKARKNRTCIVSKEDTFIAQKNAASNMASFRAAMTFQDIKNIDSSGNLIQYQPWMGAAVAAGMQTAGFYRAIVHKFANVSGVVQADGTFNDRSDDQMEDALLSGLLPLKRHPNGGFYFVSDQTTYTRDTNFVYNSIQAVYVADIIAMTTAQRMEDAFVGQSVADISAAVAMSFLKGIMADFMRLKLIAASDDAPLGFKNATITISGPAMIVQAEVKLAGAIYFIPISFLVSPVTQTANQ